MNHRIATSTAAGLLVALLSSSEATAQFPRREPTPNDSLQSTEVHDDNRVTFRIYAPKAEEVSIGGDWIAQGLGGGGNLEKDDQGVWSITVGPLPPDFYSYSFVVDGVKTLDPKSAGVKQGISSLDNMFFLPGEEAAFEDSQVVPHGEIRQVWYASSTLGTERRMHVYTPPGYDGSDERYPVLYLLHGGGDEDSGWSTIGRAGFILDNLLAAGKARPMLIVMPNGSLPRPAPRAADGAEQPSPADQATRRAEQQNRFTNELVSDVIPFVEKKFRVESDKEGRALAGLSMGGGQTLGVLTTQPDKFAYVGIWSAGLFGGNADQWEEQNEDFLASADKVNGAVKHLEIVVGDGDFALNGSRALAGVFEKRGIQHELRITSGGHTWINWRQYLRDFAQRLFQEGTITGQWRARFDSPVGVQVYAFDLRVDGAKLTGTATAKIGDEPQREPTEIRDGKVEGDKISFVEDLVFNDFELTITYSGTIQGDELHLTRQVGDFATEELVATPVKMEGAVRGSPDPAQAGDRRSGESQNDSAAAGDLRSDVAAGSGDPRRAPDGFDARRDGIERGKVETIEYDSKTVGIKRRMVIYTPPGYSEDKEYPVLYLLHGIGDTETGWQEKGSADVLLDNLLADVKILPMIVVMPNGRASAEPVPRNIFDRSQFAAYANFEKELLADVIPYVESRYSVSADREKRALAGLSMGGGQSLNFGLAHLDAFAWVGGFSSAPNTTAARELISDPAAAREKLRLLWVSCGDEDRLMDISRDFHTALDEMEIPHVWHVDSGGHTWPVWRNDLYLFSQRLFR